MFIFISIIAFVILLHLTSYIVLKIINTIWSKVQNLRALYRKRFKKGIEKGKSRKFYTIKKGGLLGYLIFILFITLLLIAVLMFLKAIKTELLCFQFFGFLILLIDLGFVAIIDNVVIVQRKINIEIVNKDKKVNKKLNYISDRIYFFIKNTMPSFYMIICILLVNVVLYIDILNFVYPDLILGLVIGFFILLSLYSNTFIMENYYFSNEKEKLIKTNNEYEVYMTQKKVVIYIGVFMLSSYSWYQDLIQLEKNFVIKDFRGDLVLITTILLFFLSTDRIFKLIHDDYMKFKKEV
ncbi:hypothetical protein [Exiguobacterium artemiae]|uniref:hypothetical protein n=1 Tax=Exiguobacterium artemiae TaxID=340145 RepID=UPI00047B5935|nr:hypothetical protein [Exiguobacterium sibiricum]